MRATIPSNGPKWNMGEFPHPSRLVTRQGLVVEMDAAWKEVNDETAAASDCY